MGSGLSRDLVFGGVAAYCGVGVGAAPWMVYMEEELDGERRESAQRERRKAPPASKLRENIKTCILDGFSTTKHTPHAF